MRHNKQHIYKHHNSERPKWEREARYYGLNFLPFLFEKKETLEFRLHSGTVNKYKAIYWTIICLSFVRYVENNIDKILERKSKILLDDIIEETLFDILDKETALKTITLLKDYINKRTEIFVQMAIVHETIGNEFRTDHFYKHNVDNLDIFKL